MCKFIFDKSLVLNLLFSVAYCEGVEVVIWGSPDSVGSTVGQRWSPTERTIMTFDCFPPSIDGGVIVRFCLSDGYLRVIKGCKNALLQFNQSVKDYVYFWFVFRLLSPLIINWPKPLAHRAIGGYRLFFVTFSNACITVLYRATFSFLYERPQKLSLTPLLYIIY